MSAVLCGVLSGPQHAVTPPVHLCDVFLIQRNSFIFALCSFIFPTTHSFEMQNCNSLKQMELE